MELTEAQKLIATGISSATLLISPVLAILWKRRGNRGAYPASARIARIILFANLFKELMAGIIHSFFPYDCHIHISHIPQGLGVPVDDRKGAFAGIALLTAVQGSREIAFALMCLIPFIVEDEELLLTTFALVVEFMCKLLVNVNTQTDLISGLHSNLPAYMQDKSSMEYVKKSPPGAHVGFVQLLSLVIGVAMALIGMRMMKKNKMVKGDDGDGGKKGD